MTAFNVVRFRTRPGMQQAFIDQQKKAEAGNFPGLHPGQPRAHR